MKPPATAALPLPTAVKVSNSASSRAPATVRRVTRPRTLTPEDVLSDALFLDMMNAPACGLPLDHSGDLLQLLDSALAINHGGAPKVGGGAPKVGGGAPKVGGGAPKVGGGAPKVNLTRAVHVPPTTRQLLAQARTRKFFPEFVSKLRKRTARVYRIPEHLVYKWFLHGMHVHWETGQPVRVRLGAQTFRGQVLRVCGTIPGSEVLIEFADGRGKVMRQLHRSDTPCSRQFDHSTAVSRLSMRTIPRRVKREIPVPSFLSATPQGRQEFQCLDATQLPLPAMLTPAMLNRPAGLIASPSATSRKAGPTSTPARLHKVKQEPTRSPAAKSESSIKAFETGEVTEFQRLPSLGTFAQGNSIDGRTPSIGLPWSRCSSFENNGLDHLDLTVMDDFSGSTTSWTGHSPMTPARYDAPIF